MSGCLGRVVSLARVADQKGLIGVEVLQGSGSRIDERGLRLDHSRCSQLAAVDMRVAVREGFEFGMGFGTVPGIGIVDMGTVLGYIGADTPQWESSPPAGCQSCSVSGPHRIHCWPE